RLGTHPTREPPPSNRRWRINHTRSEKRHDEFRGVIPPMTGKGSKQKYGSILGGVAGKPPDKFPSNTGNRSLNAPATGPILQACPEILVGCADYLIASEAAYD